MEFDDKFLQEMGLSAMPEDQKKAFLEYVQEELEVRIGERIAKVSFKLRVSGNEFKLLNVELFFNDFIRKSFFEFILKF